MDNLLLLTVPKGLIYGAENDKKRMRRTHSTLFKSKVALAVMARDKTLAELGQQFEVHPQDLTRKKQISERPTGVSGKDTVAEPSVDLKVLHANTGQLTLENDFQEGVYQGGGAKRR